MARKPTTAALVERSPALSAIEQLGRLIQTGTPVARVTRAAQGIGPFPTALSPAATSGR